MTMNLPDKIELINKTFPGYSNPSSKSESDLLMESIETINQLIDYLKEKENTPKAKPKFGLSDKWNDNIVLCKNESEQL